MPILKALFLRNSSTSWQLDSLIEVLLWKNTQTGAIPGRTRKDQNKTETAVKTEKKRTQETDKRKKKEKNQQNQQITQ